MIMVMVVHLEWQRWNSHMFRVVLQRAQKLEHHRLFVPARTNVGSHLFVKVWGCLPGRRPPIPSHLSRLDESRWNLVSWKFHLCPSRAGDQNVEPMELMAGAHESLAETLYRLRILRRFRF